MLSELRVVTDCAAVVLCTLFVQSAHQILAVLYTCTVLYTVLTYAQVDGAGGSVIHLDQFQVQFNLGVF